MLGWGTKATKARNGIARHCYFGEICLGIDKENRTSRERKLSCKLRVKLSATGSSLGREGQGTEYIGSWASGVDSREECCTTYDGWMGRLCHWYSSGMCEDYRCLLDDEKGGGSCMLRLRFEAGITIDKDLLHFNLRHCPCFSLTKGLFFSRNDCSRNDCSRQHDDKQTAVQGEQNT